LTAAALSHKFHNLFPTHITNYMQVTNYEGGTIVKDYGSEKSGNFLNGTTSIRKMIRSGCNAS
jgi:hypothetical protein